MNSQSLSDFTAEVVIGKYEYVAGQRKRGLFQLAEDSPDFTGRSQETDTIETILKSDSPTAMISAVSGMGGVGKSVLARHVGNRLKAQFPDGQLYVDLLGQAATPRSADSVLIEFLVDGFGDDPQHLPFELEALRKLFHDRLSGCKILVVLDNAGDALQVEPLLPRVRGCGAIVTSREPLTNLSGMTAENFVPLGVMPEKEAIELVQRLCPKKTMDVALVTSLVKLCGLLPLALTIVGKLLLQTASLTLVEVITDLSKERSRLRALKYMGSNNQVDARLDVEASFNLSYVRLNEAHQALFECVAVLRGQDFGPELAAVLVEREEDLARKQLDQLVALQLVQWSEVTGRYGFHDLMREFGAGKLEPEQARELGIKALKWYDDRANTFDNYLRPTSRRPIAEGLVSKCEHPLETIEKVLDTMAMEWFVTEHQNLVEAVNWSQDLTEHHRAVRLTANLCLFFQRRSFWSDWAITHQVALVSARAIGDPQGIAETMNNLGLVYQAQGKWDAAIDCYEKSLETTCAIDDQPGIAATMNNLGLVYKNQGKCNVAVDCYKKSLEIKRAIGDQPGIAQTMNNLGAVYQTQGKWDAAIDCYEKSLETMCAIGDQRGIAQTMNNLGTVYQEQGKLDEAIDCYEKSLEKKRAIGDQQGIAQTIGNLGNVYQAQGKWDEAIDYYERSLETMRAIGDQPGIAATMNNLGGVYQAQGKWDAAIDCYQKSIQSSHQIGDPQTEAHGWYNLGSTQAKLGNPAARTSYQNAKALYQQLKLTNMVQYCDNAISQIGKKKRSFSLWQSAIVLLVFGIGWLAVKPYTPAPQNGEVRQAK